MGVWIRNEAQGYGGGVVITGSKSRAYCNTCEFHNNTSVRGGGAIYLAFYAAESSLFGECGTSMKFTSTTLFFMNNAKGIVGNAIYIDIKMPRTSLYSVHFASLCFHRKSMIYINHTNNNNNNNNNNVATSPYKLSVGKPGTLTPSIIPPGVQLKGRLQVQDVFGRSCTEIKDGEYSAAVKLKQDPQITFQGSTVFRIRESG